MLQLWNGTILRDVSVLQAASQNKRAIQALDIKHGARGPGFPAGFQSCFYSGFPHCAQINGKVYSVILCIGDM